MGLDYVQAENTALQGLVVDLAANKSEARAKLAQLKEKYEHLLRGVSLQVSMLASLSTSMRGTITLFDCLPLLRAFHPARCDVHINWVAAQGLTALRLMIMVINSIELGKRACIPS